MNKSSKKVRLSYIWMGYSFTGFLWFESWGCAGAWNTEGRFFWLSGKRLQKSWVAVTGLNSPLSLLAKVVILPCSSLALCCDVFTVSLLGSLNSPQLSTFIFNPPRLSFTSILISSLSPAGQRQERYGFGSLVETSLPMAYSMSAIMEPRVAQTQLKWTRRDSRLLEWEWVLPLQDYMYTFLNIPDGYRLSQLIPYQSISCRDPILQIPCQRSLAPDEN